MEHSGDGRDTRSRDGTIKNCTNEQYCTSLPKFKRKPCERQVFVAH
ncbi:hypothetical protein BURMUCGD1_5990 [Burkholderia multivorans CGD1]|nr:hypothetical protein BURMUCGD1_5990 [Burkholderia multivorans CGD1]